jgi:cellulose biosynthesis protein BcsQ
MNITPLALKGGVGKSTVSVLLHEAIRLAGKSVAIRDWDAQATTSKALHAIGVGNETQKNASVVIFDTPPNLEHTATASA